ncbi:MAG: AAA family ATPase [Spirochaetales bacterium]|nr:AAA family ATPase [Spirochaetales bacterium]
MELFKSFSQNKFEPLAYRMRPRTLDEFCGQEHIVGQGRLLRRAIQADQLSSLIFYGPPGTGKTTLAKVIANTTSSRFRTMNAVLCGVKDLREVIAEAKDERSLYDKRTILFVDEVHRWNKAQQDALLPWVEQGTVIFIGATTQNPYFEVNSALVSRSRIFQLQTLTFSDLKKIAELALKDKERGYGNIDVKVDKDALEHMVRIAAGDARSLLNAIELAVETTPKVFPPPAGARIHVTMQIAEESIQKKVVLYDKEGDYHFDTISAFIKSLRGSDADAAFYWLAKMVYAGEDPKFIFRRMLIFAGEDVGLADPQALIFVEAAARAFERIGLPEGRYHLAISALYLATAPKSNSVMGFFDALEGIENEEQSKVPTHLKDASRDSKGFGHGEGYLYPHAFRDHWVAQQYLPKELQGRIFYQPGKLGFEKHLREQVLKRREAQLEAMMDEPPPEVLTFSPSEKQRELWLKRILSNSDNALSDIRDSLFSHIPIQRHHCVLDVNAGRGILLWEALRRVPEGCVYGMAKNPKDFEILTHFANSIPDLERPVFIMESIDSYDRTKKASLFKNIEFDIIVGRNALTRLNDKSQAFQKLRLLCKPEGYLALAEVVPAKGSRLSQAVDLKLLSGSLSEQVIKAETLIYKDEDNPLLNWDDQSLIRLCKQHEFEGVWSELKIYAEKRAVTEEVIKKWFDPETESRGYGKILPELLSHEDICRIRDFIITQIAGKVVDWRTAVILLVANKKGE